MIMIRRVCLRKRSKRLRSVEIIMQKFKISRMNMRRKKKRKRRKSRERKGKQLLIVYIVCLSRVRKLT
jgi:hypothetical protein